MILGRYMLVKKSTVCLVFAAALGLAGCCLYRRHHGAIKARLQRMADKAGDAAAMAGECVVENLAGNLAENLTEKLADKD